MKILVFGSGAREHAMAWKLARERSVERVLCAPGNPGIAAVAQCLPVDVTKPADLLALADREGVDLTVIGSEVPLSLGVVDLFLEADRAIVGPTRAAAALESSKSFAKDFMSRYGVPTAAYEVCDSAHEARRALVSGRFSYPV